MPAGQSIEFGRIAHEKTHSVIHIYREKRNSLGEAIAIVLPVGNNLFVYLLFQGTLIRIFDTTNGTQLNELRRGANNAIIYWYVHFNLPRQMCLSYLGLRIVCFRYIISAFIMYPRIVSVGWFFYWDFILTENNAKRSDCQTHC